MHTERKELTDRWLYKLDTGANYAGLWEDVFAIDKQFLQNIEHLADSVGILQAYIPVLWERVRSKID